MKIYSFEYDNGEYNEWREVYKELFASKQEAEKEFDNYRLYEDQWKSMYEIDISTHPNKKNSIKRREKLLK